MGTPSLPTAVRASLQPTQKATQQAAIQATAGETAEESSLLAHPSLSTHGTTEYATRQTARHPIPRAPPIVASSPMQASSVPSQHSTASRSAEVAADPAE